MKNGYYIYKDNKGEWRWRFVSNGEIIGVSSEGYRNHADCRRGVDLMRASYGAAIYDENEQAAGLLRRPF